MTLICIPSTKSADQNDQSLTNWNNILPLRNWNENITSHCCYIFDAKIFGINNSSFFIK